jgi:NitT/TauT family transport system ATP-binding protein
MTPSVDIGNVTLTYRGGSGGVLALKDTSLTVGHGEFAAVVGPSGCGKSSLMKLVTGLVPPDSGDIVIFGDRVRGPVKIAGMAFQNPNLLPWRKVIDNVLLPLEIVQPHRQKFRREKEQYRAQATRCSGPSARTDSTTGSLGSCPAACNNGSRSAAPDPQPAC